MLANGYGNSETGVVSVSECGRFGSLLAKEYAAESIRQVVNCYRMPPWDMAFDIEVLTLGAVCAHDLRDPSYYSESAA